MTKNYRALENRLVRTRSKLKKCNKRKLHRLTVFKSNNHIYAQIIDDTKGHTILSASTLSKDMQKPSNGALKGMDAAKIVATKLAELSIKKGINEVVFDKGAYKFHGKVKCIADTMREHGIVV